MFYKAKNMFYRLGHKQPIFKSIYSFLNSIRKFILTPLDDVNFAKVYYWYQTGKMLNLNNPSTFDEKIWWLKINYRDPLMVKCSDKYLVRDYVRSCGGEEILNELYGVYNNPFEIDYDLLPNTFFLKTNNGSGGNILCNNKDTFDAPSANKKLASYLKNNLYFESREWVYKEIEPKIIAEKVLVPYDSFIIDYRFLCIWGL